MKSLRVLRGDRTLRFVATSTGLTEMTVRKAESNPNSMSMSTALALSSFYEVPIDDIVEHTPKTAIATST